MNTEYKGFTIHNLKVNFHVAAVGFNPKGYATINAAKGAITKHLQATGVEAFAGGLPASKAASNNDADHASMTAGLEDDVGHGEDALISLDAKGHSPLAGKPKQTAKRSRNQREGHLDGYVKGKTKRGLRLGKPLCLWSVSYRNQFTRKQRKHYNGF